MRIVELDHGDDLVGEWNDWLAFLKTPEGRRATREEARRVLEEAELL